MAKPLEKSVSRFSTVICSPIQYLPKPESAKLTQALSLIHSGSWDQALPPVLPHFTILAAQQQCLPVNAVHFRRRKALLYLLSQCREESLNSESCRFLSFFATQLISWFLKWSCSCAGWMCLNASLRRWGSADWRIAFFHLVVMPSSTLSTSPSFQSRISNLLTFFFFFFYKLSLVNAPQYASLRWCLFQLPWGTWFGSPKYETLEIYSSLFQPLVPHTKKPTV